MFKKHPKELWILALSELCERFSFWGVGNLLVLFTIEYYQFSNAKAAQIYGIFTGCSAFLPFLGGWIADRWNYQAPMLLGALFNAIGCFLLASGLPSFFYVALFLIACGYGIFTPSIVTILGYTYRNLSELREAGFSIYYASINVGVFLALASLGTIARIFNWNMAFAVAGIVQLVGLIPLLWYLYAHKETHKALKHIQAKRENTRLTSLEKSRIWVIIVFYIVSLFFWMAYNQAFSSMAIFTHDFMNRQIGNWNIPEGVFLSSESFFLIILAPILSGLYAWLQKKGKDPSPATKTGYSLLFIGCCFLVMMVASLQIPAGVKHANVSSGYLIFALFFMAVGEILLAPIGLAMVSRLAPSRYTALAIGLWYASVGIAFFNGGMLASLMEKIGSLFNFFSIFVFMTIIPAIILLIVSKKLTKMSHLRHMDEIPYVEK